MSNYQELYEKWLNSSALTEDEKLQLKNVADDEVEKEDRFYKELEFGTAGLRGKVGMGSNRMNRFIIARATKALAQTIIDNGLQEKGIAIAHDPRLFSKEFAKLAALVMASNGVKAYLFEDLRPTPELSFAVRYLGTASGINITASHNPKEYNGYKVYWQEGSQIKSDISDKVLEYINSMDIFDNYVTLTEEEAQEKGLLVYIGQEIDEEFYRESLNCAINDENIDKDISVVYTPLNGAGYKAVTTVLARRGFKNVHVVDTKTTTRGMVFLLKECLRQLEENVDVSTIAERLREKAKNILTYVTIDKLDNLVKGGRLSKSQALIGGLLNIKVLTQLKETELVALDKVRGKKKLVHTLIKHIEEEKQNKSIKSISLPNSLADEYITLIKSELKEVFGYEVSEDEIFTTTPIISTHTGENAVGILVELV